MKLAQTLPRNATLGQAGKRASQTLKPTKLLNTDRMRSFLKGKPKVVKSYAWRPSKRKQMLSGWLHLFQAPPKTASLSFDHSRLPGPYQSFSFWNLDWTKSAEPDLYTWPQQVEFAMLLLPLGLPSGFQGTFLWGKQKEPHRLEGVLQTTGACLGPGICLQDHCAAFSAGSCCHQNRSKAQQGKQKALGMEPNAWRGKF